MEQEDISGERKDVKNIKPFPQQDWLDVCVSRRSRSPSWQEITRQCQPLSCL